ncbi:2OG-Fe(II) oxygenase family protein [Shewanella sp. MM_2022_3]|uniref:2OG-Fe(II) oxygenase family protein n=1 Tax=Shewanella sp. MM_2022_3 TaxID=2923280 RepID=UPI001F4C0A14|nr:2OG-Fe(II) oxygenase family protein [Shewanella sp. MM_2022_3]MCH7424841.1 2OG-Fe(II) oxygenase [Shewanella sp. MM_2022_3]
MFEFNFERDMASLREEYARDAKINIQHVWQNETAAVIANTLASEVSFDNAMFVDNKPMRVSDQQIRQLPIEAQKDLQQKILHNAANGIGFLYGSHLVGGLDGKPSPELLTSLHRFINSPDMFKFIETITGIEGICYASLQASRYIQGNFLTRHNDVVESEGRKVAFVFGFTPEWHPDWGGLLQFYTPKGVLTDTWVPTFNNLALFDVHHPHSVSFVAPFAKRPRFSVTGWFRTIAPSK